MQISLYLKQSPHNLKLSLSLVLGILIFQLSCQRMITMKSQRKFHFLYEVTIPAMNTKKEIADVVQLWIPVPQDNEFQSVTNLDIQSPYDYTIGTDPTYGNRMVYLSFLSQKKDITISLTFNLRRKEASIYPSKLTPDEQKLYIQPVKQVPRDKRFEKIVSDLLTQTLTKEKGWAIYNHTLERLVYDKTEEGWGHGDAIRACDIGKGNCTDYHSFFNAIARTAGIPARFKIGFPVPASEAGEISGYHCWTEFYTPKEGWIPLDISEADKNPDRVNYLFGNLDPDRVLFSMGRDIELAPPSSNGPVNFFIYPVMEVNGIPSSDYSTRFHFENIE